MAIQIEPFLAEHIPAAAALVAERHRRMRISAPFLDPAYESPARAAAIVESVLKNARNGLVALSNGRVVGMLLWNYEQTDADSFYSAFMTPSAVEVPAAGFAVDPGVPGVVRRLLAAASQNWLDDGNSGFYLYASVGDRQFVEELVDLGFALHVAFAACLTANAMALVNPNGLKFRLAGPDDLDQVFELATELLRSFSESPIFFPFSEDALPSLRSYLVESLDDSGSAYWLACKDDIPIAMQHFVLPDSVLWHQDPLVTANDMLYLFMAVTRPEARGAGVNTALFRHTQNWAREQGFGYCSLHYLPASFASEYWQRLGFEPFRLWMARRPDARRLPN